MITAVLQTCSLRQSNPSIIAHYSTATAFRRIRPTPHRVFQHSITAIRTMFATQRRTDGVKTYSNQASLPRLPIPDLDKSLEGYLRSLIPVLEQKYGPKSLAKEIEKRKLFARDFAGKDGLGRVLQERLKDLDHVSPNSWLDDSLWLGLAYHTWRAPLLVNSNYWILFAPDPSDPAPPTYNPTESSSVKPVPQPDANPPAPVPAGSQRGGAEWLKNNKLPERIVYEDVTSYEDISEWQIKKSAWMVKRYAEFRQMVADETLPPDVSRAGPLCMNQYKKLFNFSRIPFPGSDAFSAIAPNATHIAVMIDDFVYSVQVFKPSSTPAKTPEPLPVDETAKSLRGAARDARQRRKAGEEPVRIGVLTADERDTWAQNRERLLLVSSKNRESLASISTSLLCLSLDPYTIPSVPTTDPLVLPPIDAQVRNGEAGLNGGRNRWLDKGTSVVVETNGRASLAGEHSPVDALIPNILMDYVTAVPVDKSQYGEEVTGETGWSRVDFVADEALKREIVECEGRNRTLIEDSDPSQLWFAEYGIDWIKKNAMVSPDAFIQQILQLAWYRDQGYATATYETASTRAMLHGRTDVIRSLSVESREFVKAMLDETADDADRYEKLVQASNTHTALTKRSSSGHGWDRHLMGLKVMLRGDETHQIFEDEMYGKSQEWKLSTSGLSAGPRLTGSGFGAAWPDGYGINYLAGTNLIKFGIESKWSCGVTSTGRFKHNIVQSFRDVRKVVEAQSQSAKAKM